MSKATASRLRSSSSSERAHLDRDCQLERWDETAKVEFDRALLNELASLRFLEAHLVLFCCREKLVNTHPRKAPGQKSIDMADYPPEATACAQRDAAYFVRQAEELGEHIGRFAAMVVERDSRPWTRMRQLFKLLSLARKYGGRLDASCKAALDADMVDVTGLAKLVQLDTQLEPPPAARVIPIARYLRPANQYALPFAPSEREDNEGGEP